MARLPYATKTQLAQLMRQSGLPESTAPANAFRMLASYALVVLQDVKYGSRAPSACAGLQTANFRRR